MKGARRLSVRLNLQQWAQLEEKCQQAGLSVTQVVRQALDALLANGQGGGGSGTAPPRLTPPDEAIKRTPRYLAWGRGNLREQRNELFVELLAAAYVCKKHYSRTPGMVEGYLGLLQLCQFFGVE